jgi:hypothetical protein
MPFKDPLIRREKARLRMRRYRYTHPNYRRDQHLWLTFGITFDEWAERFKTQKFSCAACGTAQAGRSGQGKDGCWHTDHNPALTKADPRYVRGILCHWCNIALHRHQTPVTLHALANYLEKHG